MPRVSVGKLVGEAQRSGESLESLLESTVRLAVLMGELDLRRSLNALDPEHSEMDKVSMVVAGWLANRKPAV